MSSYYARSDLAADYFDETFEFLTFSKFGHNKNSMLQASIVQNRQLFKGLFDEILFEGKTFSDFKLTDFFRPQRERCRSIEGGCG
jgi:hypothetical protein